MGSAPPQSGYAGRPVNSRQLEEAVIRLIERYRGKLDDFYVDEYRDLAEHGECAIAIENLSCQVYEFDLGCSGEDLVEMTRLVRLMGLDPDHFEVFESPARGERAARSVEARIGEIICSCRTILPDSAMREVDHYFANGEPEMAFEGLVIELMNADVVPPTYDFKEWRALMRDTGIDVDPVFDGDFWQKFVAWARKT